MPRVKTFDKRLAIWVFADDHRPPHFHVKSPGTDVLVDLRTLTPIIGTYDRRDFARAIEWASAPENRAMIEAEWRRLNEQG